MIKAIINRRNENVRYYGKDKYDGLTTSFFENGIDNNMDDEEIQECLEERLEEKLNIIFE